MKLQITLVAAAMLGLSSLSVSAGLPDVPREFAVSQMGQGADARTQFLKLWAALQDSREPGAVEIRFSVIKPLAASSVADPMHAYQVTLEGGTVAVVQLSAATIAAGERVAARVVADGVWTRSSSDFRLPLYREAAKVAPPTREEFLALIRAGRTFPVLVKESCSGCLGDGLLGALSAGATCPDCYGTGKSSARWVLKN